MSAGIATSDPRATAAGAQLLVDGATAIDAAVAAALVLYVVEPQSCGPGGDAFMIHVDPGRDPVALDGSGALPAALDDAALAAAGLDTIPARGAASATVPGAMRLLEDAVAKFGHAVAAELAATGARARGAGGSRCVRRSPTPPPVPPPRSATIRCSGRSTCRTGSPVAVGDMVVNPVLAECLADDLRERVQVLHDGELGRPSSLGA